MKPILWITLILGAHAHISAVANDEAIDDALAEVLRHAPTENSVWSDQ